ncbi:hypothetical protein ES705_46348 [subsurface metagenome]|jgi:hypothetical protein
MTLDEAIRLKQLEGEEFLHADPDELDEADRLLIDIGKRVLLVRRFPDAFNLKTLPGETEE